ncbi:MAG TPA: hypothetical protein VFE77_06070, partial [Rhodanobacter sp.]|nr:hypothetical protein [Rhodanobacter sp.]
MSTFNAFKAVSMTLVAAAVCLSLQAHATTVNTFVNFIAPDQSLWGPGGPPPINLSDSASWDLPLGLGTEGFGYGFNVTAGTVMGTVAGTFATSYTPVMSAPGVANIGLQYNGGGFVLSSIGASASLTVFGQTFGPSIGLNVTNNFVLGPYGIPSIVP